MVVAEDSAQEHLARYLPPLLADWDVDAGARHRVVEGTVAFVDISGFTKLSERLAKHGKIGAEALTETIDRCFVELLGIAGANGGQQIKFGGDALLLLFTGDGQAVRACRAVADMRRALRDVGRQRVLDHPVVLKMSVGVHSGKFDFFLIGRSHRELMVTGPAATTTVTMEATAVAGEILVSDATAALLPAGCLGERKGEGTLLKRVPKVEGLSSMPRWPDGPARAELGRFLPLAVRKALSAGIRLSEHRRAAVAFVHFDGTDALLEEHGPEEAGRVLERLVSGIQEAADRNEVAFLSSDIDHDGGKVILTSGVPLAAEDAEDRMLRAVREIVDTTDGPVTVRIGVHRAPLFVGEIGPAERRSFTVMGDAVNLAARVMAKARPGQILCTADFLERTRLSVEAEALEPFMVKGKAKPVTAFSVGALGQTREPMAFTAAPFVGRSREFEVFENGLAAVRKGRRSVVDMVGEPGVGKTRLINEVRARANGFRSIEVVSEPYDEANPFRAARLLLADVLGMDGKADHDEAVEALRAAVVGADPGLLPRLPLLGVVLGLTIAETAETGELEDRFRRPLMAQTLVELLRRLLTGPTLMVFEDAHFMDDVSAEILAPLMAAEGDEPWLVVIARREADGGLRTKGGSADEIRLGTLSDTDGQALVDLMAAEAPLPRHIVAALTERSGGNPLFLIGIVSAAIAGTDMDELPDSVEAVVTARIDQLPLSDRYLLRRASVLGRSFPAGLLDAVIDDPVDDEAPERLVRFLLWEDGVVRFTHALLRERSYDGLPYRLRRELHARAGDAIVKASGEDPDEQAGLLALHFLHAQRYGEAYRFALVAARRATASFADVESVGFYEHAVEAARHLGELGPTEEAALYEDLADARYRVGLYTTAETAYRRARRLRGGEPVAEARVLLKLGRLQGWLDCYPRALRWISRALRILDGVDGDDATRQRAHVLAWYGRFCQEEGRHKRAMKWCERAVAEATATGEKEALANALKVLDWARMDLGLLQEPVDWRRALVLFEDIGDSPSVASMFNFLGGYAYWRGEWTEALEYYGRAQETVNRTGNAVMDAFCRNNIAEIALDQGRLEESERLFSEALAIWRAAEYRSVIASATCNLARLAAARGAFDEALRLFEESAAEADHVGGQAEMREIKARTAECLLLAGDGDGALAMAEGCLEQLRSTDGVPPQKPLLERIRGVVLFGRGALDEARAALDASLVAARTRDARYEVALTLKVRAEIERSAGHGDVDELERESDAILGALGVEWVPRLVAVPA